MLIIIAAVLTCENYVILNGDIYVAWKYEPTGFRSCTKMTIKAKTLVYRETQKGSCYHLESLVF